jgi:hypothetical protein
MRQESISDEAIRKRLSRMGDSVQKMKGFFLDNQVLFYLREQYRKPEYYEGLVRSFPVAAKRYHAVLTALRYHQGSIHKSRLASYTFSPIASLTGHKRIDHIIEDLVNWELIRVDEDYIFTTDRADLNESANFNFSKGIELARMVVLNQFAEWARGIGMVSYDSVKTDSEFGKLQWGFTGPSYITGITQQGKDKVRPAFVVADVLVGREADLDDVYFFLQKIEILKHQRNASNFLPYLITQGVQEDAFRELKRRGVITASVNKLFGNEYLELLKSLISTITNAGAILKTNPEAYLKLITQIEKLAGGKTNNLRGDLFELAVGYYYSNRSQVLDVGKLITHEGRQKELDVLAVASDEVHIAECKGYNYPLDVATVEVWLNEKVPVAYKWAIAPERYQGKKIIFELWSTGGFTDDAKRFLEEHSQKTTKYKVEFYDQSAIMTKARTAQVKKLTEIMRAYFVKEI